MEQEEICVPPFNFGECEKEDLIMTIKSATSNNIISNISGNVKMRGDWVTVSIPTFSIEASAEVDGIDRMVICTNLESKYLGVRPRIRYFCCQSKLLNPISKVYNIVPTLISMDETGNLTIIPWNIIKYYKTGTLKLKTQTAFQAYKEFIVNFEVFGINFTYCLNDDHEFDTDIQTN